MKVEWNILRECDCISQAWNPRLFVQKVSTRSLLSVTLRTHEIFIFYLQGVYNCKTFFSKYVTSDWFRQVIEQVRQSCRQENSLMIQVLRNMKYCRLVNSDRCLGNLLPSGSGTAYSEYRGIKLIPKLGN
jgi:hypothetical protein